MNKDTAFFLLMSLYRDTDPLYEKIIFLITLNAVLLFFIFLFWAFPEFHFKTRMKQPHLNMTIEVADIPSTKQPPEKPNFPRRPPFPEFVPVLADTVDFPLPLSVDTMLANQTQQIFSENGWWRPEIPARPVVDIIPELQNIRCNGQIKLLLLISKLGKVKQVQLVWAKNLDEECVQRLMAAAQNTRWLPARFQGEYVDCWVEKSYRVQKH